MTEILRSGELKVAKDLSGGVKIVIGGSAGLLSPEQTIELATVLLRLVGIDVQFSSQIERRPTARQDFLAG
jgi:hypothetical protein